MTHEVRFPVMKPIMLFTFFSYLAELSIDIATKSSKNLAHIYFDYRILL